MRSLLARKSVRLLTLSYAVALSLIATASITIHNRMADSIVRQDQMGAIINVSGRQRMLSQRIAFLRAEIEMQPLGAVEETLLADFSEAVEAFRVGHNRLTRGDLVWREGHPAGDELSALYYDDGLDDEVRRYVVAAQLFADAARQASSAPIPLEPDALLPRLDAVVQLHERAHQGIIEDARRFSAIAVLGVLALLLIEAVAVVAPTARRLGKVEDELTALATTDPLTGAQNRRALFSAAEGLIKLAARARRPVSTIVLDIDHFKRVNDEHGHAVGDEAIKHVVDLTRGALRESDLLGRVGGEEFVILCPETSTDGGLRVAEKVRAAIEATPLPLGEGSLPLTVSIGVHGVLPHREDMLDEYVSAADEALYEAKRTGRNKVVASRSADKAAALAIA